MDTTRATGIVTMGRFGQFAVADGVYYRSAWHTVPVCHGVQHVYTFAHFCSAVLLRAAPETPVFKKLDYEKT